MKQAKLLFLLIAALAFASCGSDEPRYADPEAHEKMNSTDSSWLAHGTTRISVTHNVTSSASPSRPMVRRRNDVSIRRILLQRQGWMDYLPAWRCRTEFLIKFARNLKIIRKFANILKIIIIFAPS